MIFYLNVLVSYLCLRYISLKITVVKPGQNFLSSRKQSEILEVPAECAVCGDNIIPYCKSLRL